MATTVEQLILELKTDDAGWRVGPAGEQLRRFDADTKAAQGGLTILADRVALASKELDGLPRTAENAARGLDGLQGSAGGLAAMLRSGLGAAAAALGISALSHTVTKSTSDYEMSVIGLGALVTAYNDLHDASGRLLKGQEALHEGMAQARGMTDALAVLSIQTGKTSGELQEGYQILYGLGTAAGGSQKDILRLSQALANMTATEHLPFGIMAREAAMAEGGFERLQSRLGIILASKGIAPQTLQTWKQQGDLVKRLADNLQEFQTIGPEIATSWQGVTTTLETMWGKMAREGFSPIMTAAKSGVMELSSLLGTGLGPLLVGLLSDAFAGSAHPLARALVLVATGLLPVIALLLHVALRQHRRIRLDLQQQGPAAT